MSLSGLQCRLPVLACLFFCLLLSACGDSARSPGHDRLGVFYDSPVQGLGYVVAGKERGRSGETDASGRFVYRDGQSLQFSLAHLALGGPVAGAAFLSPRDLFGAAPLADRRVINLARLLQSLDADGQTANGIDLRAAAAELSDLPPASRVTSLQLDVEPDAFAAANPELMAWLASSGRSLVATDSALRHLECSERDVIAGRQPDGLCEEPLILVEDIRIPEGDVRHVLEVPLALSAASVDVVTVSYETVSGTAVAGADFEAVSGTLTFLAGETSQRILIPILGDRVHGPDKQLLLRLSAPVHAGLARQQATITLVNDDEEDDGGEQPGLVRLRLEPAAWLEGTGDALNTVHYRIRREGDISRSIELQVSTENGTALAGEDFVALTALPVTLPAGAAHVDVPLQLVADNVVETDETFRLHVTSTAERVEVTGSPVTLTIINDDQAPDIPLLALTAPLSVPEGDEGSRELFVRAALSAPAPGPVVLTYATRTGTARDSGEHRDYDAVLAREVTIPAGGTFADLPVTVHGDRFEEFDEHFFVQLLQVRGAAMGDVREVMVTLRNDDELTLLQVGSARVSAEPTDVQVAGIEESYLGGKRTQRFHLGGFGFGPFKILPGYGPLPELRFGEDPLAISNAAAGARCLSPELAHGDHVSHCEDAIAVRALVLHDPRQGTNLALVTVDAVGAGNLIQDAVKQAVHRASCALGEALCIPASNVLFGQTHTHAGADLQGLWGGVPQSWQREQLAAGAARAVTEALQARVPARLSLARGEAAEFNKYRRPVYRQAGHHITDKTLSLFMARADDADPDDARLVGTLLQYSAHPTSVGAGDYRREDGSVVRVPHADYPVGATDRLEELFGAAAIYFNGPIADAAPAGPGDGSNVYERVKSRGRLLADRAAGLLANAVPIDPVLSVRHQEVVLPVSNPLFLAVGLLGQFNGYYQFMQLPRDRIPGLDQLPEDMVSRFEGIQNQLPQPALVARTLVSRISLGTADPEREDRNRLEIVTIPGETTNTFGQYIRRLAGESPLSDARPKTHTILLGLTQNSFGYIVPEDEFSYIDPAASDGLPGAAYEEYVSLGPLTAPLLRLQGYNRLFDVPPTDVRNLPPLLTDCAVALDFGACFAGVLKDRAGQVLAMPAALLKQVRQGLVSVADGCRSVAGPLQAGCAVFDALAGLTGALPLPGGDGGPPAGDNVDLALFPEVLKAQAQGCDILDPAACMLPYPSNHFTKADSSTDTGLRVSIHPLAPPRNVLGRPVDVTEFNRNDGFSPAQPILVRVPGLDLARTADAGTLVPRIDNMAAGLDLSRSAVVVYDVTADQPHLVWAELDANATAYTPCDLPAPLQTLAELGDQPDAVQAVESFRKQCNQAISPLTGALSENNPLSDPGPVLIIRPGVNFEEGHRYIVALRRLRDGAGDAIPAGPAFRLCRGDADSLLKSLPLVKQRCDQVADVLDTLERQAGIARDDLYLAWDFTVASERNLTERLLGIRDHAFNTVLKGGVPSYRINAVEDADYRADASDCLEPVGAHARGNTGNCVARIIRGTMDVPNYISVPLLKHDADLINRQIGGRFNYEPGAGSNPLFGDGIPDQSRLQPTVQVPFTCHIPRAVMARPEASLGRDNDYAVRPSRLSLYGHGLFGTQSEIGQGQLRRFGNEHNVTFCATDWVGMSGTGDVVNALTALLDMSNFPSLTDRVQQGVLHFQFLARLMRDAGGFASNAAFQAPDGRPLIDNREVFYDGNSQGGIIGGVVVATSPDVHRGVLGVPGMAYSTLLQRSVDFYGYARFMYPSYPNTVDQQLVFAMIQMLWDRAENSGYAQHLGSGESGRLLVGDREVRIGLPNRPLPGPDGRPMPVKQVLLHPGFGDHQVAMVSAEVMARTVGAGYDVYYQRHDQQGGDVIHTYDPLAPLAEVLAARYPGEAPAYAGLPRLAYDRPEVIRGSGLVVYDEGRTALPPSDNLPPFADDFDSHEYPRNTVMGRCQKARFLRSDGRLVYTDLLTDPRLCPWVDGTGEAFSGDADPLQPGEVPVAPVTVSEDRGSGVLGLVAEFVARLNDALMSLLGGDFGAAFSQGRLAFESLGQRSFSLAGGDDSLVAAGRDALAGAAEPQTALERFLDGVGRFLGLQDDPLSTLMAMKPQRAVEVVIMTGAQLPGWAVLPAAGVGHPYPSGANITGQADETEALAFLNVLRDPLRLGEVRDAHNGTFIYPLAGQQLPALAAVEDIAAWRWDGERFVEIPVQVDEKFPFFLANAGSTFSVYSGTDSELTYAWDTENWDARDNPENPCLATYPAGKRDPVPGLDLDDEIVFMASDAGGTAPLGQMPPGAVAVQMVRLADALDPGAERVVYLTQQPGGSSFRGRQHYVRYQRQPGADQWIDRTFFRDDDPEKLGTSNTSYGANRKGIVCPDGTPASARESTDRFPRDGLVVTTDTYRWEATGRWMVRDIRIRAPGTDKPDWAQLKDSRPDLIDRWKGRAFQQSPDSTLSIVGFEDEQVNWEANATLLGERCGPVRCIRETWGADSGTNVTKTETFYRDAVSYRYRVRVHPIPPDGLYTNWDYNRSAMVPTPAEAAAGVRGGRYYTLLRPQGVPIDGINDDIGQIDAVPPVFGQCVTLDGPVPADANGRCPLFFDVADPTFNLPLAFSSWEQVSGKGDSGSLVYTFQLLGPTSLVNPVVVPYYRDDACFDDGTGDDPVQRPWPGEASTDARVVAGYRDLDGNGVVDCHERQGAHGAHGLHFLVMHDSDNAFTPLPTTEVDGQQWQIMVPTAQPTNVGDAYANIIRVPLLPIAVPLPVLSR